MDKALFYSVLNNPNLLDSEKIKELEKLSNDFPAFLPSSFLYLRSLKDNKSVYFDKQLKLIALKTPNRVLLNEFLTKDFDEVEEVMIQEEVNDVPIESNIPDSVETSDKNTSEVKEDKVKDLEADILNHAIHSSISLEVSPYVLEDIQEEESKTSEIEKTVENTSTETTDVKNTETPEDAKDKNKDLYSWLESVSFTGQTYKPKPLTPKKEEKIEKVDRSELIEKFIQDEPRIKVKKDFYNPSDMAKKSVLDDNELVTETLAKIYADQGNYSKAIKAYEKLSLKYPEKSTYFADRIKEVKEKRKNS